MLLLRGYAISPLSLVSKSVIKLMETTVQQNWKALSCRKLLKLLVVILLQKLVIFRIKYHFDESSKEQLLSTKLLFNFLQ